MDIYLICVLFNLILVDCQYLLRQWLRSYCRRFRELVISVSRDQLVIGQKHTREGEEGSTNLHKILCYNYYDFNEMMIKMKINFKTFNKIRVECIESEMNYVNFYFYLLEYLVKCIAEHVLKIITGYKFKIINTF